MTWTTPRCMSPHRCLHLLAGMLVPLLLLSACVTNPVTGESDFIPVGEDWDARVGAANYAPMRQAQGGDYDLDSDLVAYVQRVGQRVAAASDVELPYEFEVINNSVPNAWALPSGKIAVNRGLLTALETEAELAAVLAHEVVHAAARHSAQAQGRGMLLQVPILATAIATSDKQYGQLATVGAQLGAGLINQRYSREAELESDLYGMRYMARAGYDPQGAVTLQEKFMELAKDRRQDWLSGLFASHPPSQERVQRNRATAQALAQDGEIGRQTYQRHLAYLERVQPAYEAADEATEALAAKNYGEAERLTNRALRIEPREARFHSLLGDIDAAQERYAQAEQHYGRAIARDRDWFYLHYARGLARERQNEHTGARADYQRSLELFPHPLINYRLGTVEQALNNRQAAIAHFRIAARAGGELGQAARQQLAQMGVAAQ